MYPCQKCDKKFKRAIDLQRHNFRKIPCDRILKCDRCNKVFNKKYDLTNHINKKTPCILAITPYEIQKLQLTLKVEEIKLENNKTTLENNKLEIEKLKLQNKNQTYINNSNNDNSITNSKINNIIGNTSNITINNFGSTEEIMYVIPSPYIDKAKELIEDSCGDTIINILRHIYRNDEFPEDHNLVYLPDQKKFYIMENGNWYEKTYDDISPHIYKCIKHVIRIIKTNFCPNFDYHEFNPDIHMYEEDHKKVTDAKQYVNNDRNSGKIKKAVVFVVSRII